MSTLSTITISVELSEDATLATVRFGSRSNPIVCNVLGVDYGADDLPKVIYLDSLIHNHSKDYKQWLPTGAVTTILTRDIDKGGH